VPPARRSAGSGGRPWRPARPAPGGVVPGPAARRADRAGPRVVTTVRAEGEVEVSDLEAATYEDGALAVLASPSLFEERRLVVVRGIAEATEGAVADVLAYLAEPQDDVVLVLQHSGGPRAKKVVDAAKAVPGAVWVDCPAVKNDTDRLAFVAAEFADTGRRISSRAAQELVDAVGSDLPELAAVCTALLEDVEGDVDVPHVRSLTQGRSEATGFEVADAVVARDTGRSLLLLRQALDTGVDPIPLVAAIAMKLRGMAKVAAAGRGPGTAKELGMAPWMVDRARSDLRHWRAPDLADAIMAVAEVDVALKGGVEIGRTSRGRSNDHVYTLERLVLRLTGTSA
jgi:DNA polymerase-3 subunit delta